jgi:hypothetical protein
MSKIYLCIKNVREERHEEMDNEKIGLNRITIDEWLKLYGPKIGAKYEEIEVEKWMWGNRDRNLWLWLAEVGLEEEKINFQGKKYTTSATIYPKELFATLAEFRDKQIDSIINE